MGTRILKIDGEMPEINECKVGNPQRSYTNLGVRSPFPSVFFYRAYSAPNLGALSGHLVIGQLRSHETNRRRVSDNNNTDC